jgi:hypothetical protein
VDIFGVGRLIVGVRKWGRLWGREGCGVDGVGLWRWGGLEVNGICIPLRSQDKTAINYKRLESHYTLSYPHPQPQTQTPPINAARSLARLTYTSSSSSSPNNSSSSRSTTA